MARVLRNHDHTDALDTFRICLSYEVTQGSKQNPLRVMPAKREVQIALHQTERIKEALNLARELRQD